MYKKMSKYQTKNSKSSVMVYNFERFVCDVQASWVDYVNKIMIQLCYCVVNRGMLMQFLFRHEWLNIADR